MICAFPGNEAFAARLEELILVCTLNDPDAKALPLLFAARTAKGLGAASVGLVAPYLGYMRQDRRFAPERSLLRTVAVVLLKP